jgi:predicted esterase
MNTKRFGAAFVALLSMLATPTLVSAQMAPAAASSSGASLVTVRELSGDVYEFDYLLTTGPGKYHQVGVHRVVEVDNGKPMVSHNAIFLVHGTFGTFNAHFMGGTNSPESIPVYLASRGIDVWGIDSGWALVPETETDFTFMKSWGFQREVDDLEQAIEFARDVRVRTGSDGQKVALLGYSQGGTTGYALINEETQRTFASRQVRGYISVDAVFTSNDPTFQANSCSGEALFQQYGINLGVYNDNSGVYAEILGSDALVDPNGASSLVPGYTNQQALLISGAAPWEFSPGIPPYLHDVAGIFGPGGLNSIPTGFHYTPVTRYANVLADLPAYQPVELDVELNAVQCGDGPAQYSNHLDLVRIPVLSIGAAGGEAVYASFTLTQLGSTDKQSYLVHLYPPDQYALDYGHFDLFNAHKANVVVWGHILAWLTSHETD